MEKHLDQKEPKPIPLEYSFRRILRSIVHNVCDFDLSWQVIISLCVIEVVVFTYIGYIGAVVIGLLFFLLRHQFRIRKDKVLSNTKEMFSRNVLAVNPGLDTKKWHEVASKMNNEFYEQDYWRSRHFFCDGDECHNSFREHILRPSVISAPDVSLEAVKRYSQATNEVYKKFLQDEFPSNPKSLPGNERYGRFMRLISDRGFLKNVRSPLGFAVLELANDSYSMITIWLLYYNFKDIFGAYESHIKEKYKAVDITQRVKFLATVMHFAPGDDLEKWDRIASHMNWYLRVEGIWTHAHEKFADGKECLDFYESQFMLLPLKSEDTSYSDLKDIVRETNKVCAPS
ncbi:ZYRO0C18590p [Zygosaccharomyces rouxii]|uniref:ZYRO0C18590p n=1 Tax=Zygosaccharomyces rouxii (strain ATCC 2623 / CBS 732 / NBRC 1130 / NCYC 568 / NRRL Y-229) TaxID=559307 RepID=C5DUP7_ZYGRC|nr:uncharacterized protein ZYRO0C18590g [Zygosaccharomyces rouxii]KAH9199721.1 hypothetical protein LQ764DRAFT_210857 [Zygosaccharomyces rouxii]CAR27508.1 ZYRO0C18590p [Zygosaccharomyces rouxii]